MSMNKITGYHESSAMPARVRDVLGRLKITAHQNVYEADFEYGSQPLRWEQLTQGAATITQVPSSGGVRMRVTNAAGDATIRQSRPYHRYQPGKTMFMATGVQLSTATPGNIQRVGFFDDSNGVFFEQSVPYPQNPYGIYAVVRSDVGGTVQELRIGLDQWNGDMTNINQINFNNIQMFWMEFAWYGAGAVRWGFWLNGEPVIGHQIGFGNLANQTTPWARTGNLPVRYEQRNINAITPTTNDMYHYGVSVIVEGQRDEQRGFTYSYGLPNLAPTATLSSGGNNRYPVLTVRGRQMGTLEYGNIYGRNDAGATTTATSVISATFTGYISGTTLTLTGATPISNGTVAVGMCIVGLGNIQTQGVNNAVTPYTVIVSGSGQTTNSTWQVQQSQTVGSAASPVTFTGYALTMTLTGTPLTSNQFQGRQIYFPNNGASAAASPACTGTGGTNTVTVTSANGITVGAVVTGTGIIANNLKTYVTGISGTTVTLSQNLSSNVSGNLTFTGTFGSGAIARIVYHTASVLYFVDPVFQGALPATPSILASPVTQSYASGGASGSYTVLVSSNTGIAIGQAVSGTNVAPGAQVTGINGTTITMSLPAVGQIAGTLSFTTGFIIGLANRGQLLPKRLYCSQSATTQVLVELIASTPTNPTVLGNGSTNYANFNQLQYLGSAYSFGERDVTATSLTGGEVVFGFVLSSGSGVQDLDFTYVFPLYNNIRGSGIDTLTIAISSASGTAPVVGANLVVQEAMS